MSETFIKINCERVGYTLADSDAAGGSLGMWFDRIFPLLTVLMKGWGPGSGFPLKFSFSPPQYSLDLPADSDFEIHFHSRKPRHFSIRNGFEMVYLCVDMVAECFPPLFQSKL
jgi:hypothetical protein